MTYTRPCCLPLLAILLLQVFTTGCGAQDAKSETAPEFKITRELRDRMERETQMTIDIVQRIHYSNKSFASLEPDEILNKYLEDLDFSRLFLLESDRETIIDRFGSLLKPVYLAKGDLYPAFEIYTIYRERVLNRLNWIESRLNEPFDFTLDETYNPERNKAAWPTTLQEGDSLWEKRLKYELIFDLLNDDPMSVARERLVKRYNRMRRYLLNIEPHEVQELFLNAITGLYDPHTSFMSVESAEDFDIAISNSLVGIGAMLTDDDGLCTIRQVMPGGPAERSNQLFPGDIIIEVAQGNDEPIDIVGQKLSKTVNMIRGKKGSVVRLTIMRGTNQEKKVITLIRDEIKLTSNLATATLYDVPLGNTTVPIGVIDLPSFYGSSDQGSAATTDDVRELIERLQRAGIKGLVLDLRRNGGGLLNEAIRLTGLFISKGPVVQVRYTDGEVRKDWDEDPSLVYDGPLAVLVSHSSASASEIVAGALQSLNRAVIIGDSKTHGKGTVQTTWPLEKSLSIHSILQRAPKMGMLKVTFQKFYLPNGASTQLEGVHSDITISSEAESIDSSESKLDHALPWDTIAPIDFDFKLTQLPPTGIVKKPLLDTLKAASAERQTSLPEFAFLNERVDFFTNKLENKALSLNLEQRRAQKLADTELKDELEDKRDLLAMDRYPFTIVELNVTLQNEREHQQKLMENALPNGRTRSDVFYQNTFYYHNPKTDRISEIQIDQFNYQKLQKKSEAIATQLGQSLDATIPAKVIDSILNTFKNTVNLEDFKVMDTLQNAIGKDISDLNWDEVATNFFLTLIQTDPDILLERSKLDIPLRESLRVITDWIAQNQGVSVAQKQP
jgi:carboxyl-terminal processing protease